ncbi:MAG: FAD-dependent oxidoreductase [Acidimicrobiales bacterium]
MSELRNTNLDRLDGAELDVLIVGGGINGAVAAAALSGRGAAIGLVDRGDFAGVTSQESSNLVWGGFKYLENYDLRLVRKLCRSRNRLMQAYPANIAEIGFLAALGQTAPFPHWLAGAGSFAYWAIGDFKTAAPRMLSRHAIERMEPLIDTSAVKGGIEYADAHLKDNDARFVFSFVRTALDHGATAANYVELVSAEWAAGVWRVGLRDVEGGAELSVTTRALVNAAGPFADGLNEALDVRAPHRIVHSKGIHLIVDQLTPNDRVLAFFDDSRRLFYVIPMGRRSMIGTTDTRTDEQTSEVTAEDRSFLLGQLNDRLDLPQPLTEADIIAERCGTRPLVVSSSDDDQREVDWTSLSRKHEIDLDRNRNVVSVFGGKLTDCLNVGEEISEAVAELGIELEPHEDRWFGEPPAPSRRAFYRQARGMRLDDLRDRPGTEPLSDRLWRRYGRRAFDLLDDIRQDPRQGEDIMDSADYLRAELHHTAENEMVVELDDFLRRRSKIAQVTREADIHASRGLDEVADVLFGSNAVAKLAAYESSALDRMPSTQAPVDQR